MSLRKIIALGLLPMPALTHALSHAAGQPEHKKPNVLVFITDDHSAPHAGCYDNKDIITPNLDKFAREGMVFWRAYVTCPQCSPSRASILTGRSPVCTMTTRFATPLHRSVITYPEYLIKEAGYYAGVCGRSHHQDGPDTADAHPIYKELNVGTMKSRMQYVKTAGPDASGGGKHQIAQFYEFMEVRDKTKPFWLQLSFSDPHRPYTAPKVHDPESLSLPWHYPDTKGVREDFAAYYDEIHRVDGFFGRVLEYLDQNGLRENTIVIFLGDNGAAQFRGKGTLYEFGINVPLVIRWPGVVKPGGVCREIISLEDLAPTVMEAAGLRPKPDMTGISFLPILKGSPAPTRKYAFAERGAHGHNPPTEFDNVLDQGRVIVSKDYKLIYNCQPALKHAPVDFSEAPFFKELAAMHKNGRLDEKFVKLYFYNTRPLLELYDLAKDPREENNLAADKDYAGIKDALLKELITWMLQERDHLPLPIRLLDKK